VPGACVHLNVLDLGFGASWELESSLGVKPPRRAKPQGQAPGVASLRGEQSPQSQAPDSQGESGTLLLTKPIWHVAGDPFPRQFLRNRGAGRSKPGIQHRARPGRPPMSACSLKDGNPTANGFKRP
jgi:hypothetical protein